MTKRYYISKVILVVDEEAGTRDAVLRAAQIVGEDAIAASNVAIAADGTLVLPWALCVVEANNHAVLMSDPDIYPLPVFPLDAKVSSMQTHTKATMLNALAARNIPTDWIGSADGFRDVVRGLGRLANPAFDENAGSWAI